MLSMVRPGVVSQYSKVLQQDRYVNPDLISFSPPQMGIGAECLSMNARVFWAKSGARTTGLWSPVYLHLIDSMHIAELVFDQYLVDNQRALLAKVWGGNIAKAKQTLLFLAGLHDLGKITPHFASQNLVLAERIQEAGIIFDVEKDYAGARLDLPHGLAGRFVLRDYLMEHGWNMKNADEFARIIGIHHGRYPTAEILQRGNSEWRRFLAHPDLSEAWCAGHREIIEWIALRTGFPLSYTENRPLAPFPIEVSTLYATAIVLADWCASNEEYFPLISRERTEALSIEEEYERFRRAQEKLVLPHPLALGEAKRDIDEVFRERFSFEPTELQSLVARIAREENPDLLLLEAPPGSGKTEAALIAVEELIRNRGSQGVFVALPTRATTDAMFTRVKSWVMSAAEASDEWVNIHLAHGQNELNEDFANLLQGGRALEVFDDSEVPLRAQNQEVGIYASAWMLGRWRSTLAPVVIGTIDHVLLAALKSRHTLLRHLGLSGKIVLLDEIHAADTFMQSYLESALTWLGMYGVPVVMLSATLPASRRIKLVEAYCRGRHYSIDTSSLEGNIGYPSVVAVLPRREENDRAKLAVTVLDKADYRVWEPVEIKAVEAYSERMLARVIRRMVADGGNVAIVRNTVKSAQETYRVFQEYFPAHELFLVHSRFLARDRAENDRILLRDFGKNAQRPKRKIVIATQVIEQSLDLDFDVIITDPAPADLVFQRMGRLHRHPQTRRALRHKEAKLYILLSNKDKQPWGYEYGTDAVYGKYKVLKFLALLDEGEGKIEVTSQREIARLTQKAYSEVQYGNWEKHVDNAREKEESTINSQRNKARVWQLDDALLQDWTGEQLDDRFAGAGGDGETQSQGGLVVPSGVRDGVEQIPVVVIPLDPELSYQATYLPWTEKGGETFDLSRIPDLELVREIRSWSINLTPHLFKKRRNKKTNDEGLEASRKDENRGKDTENDIALAVSEEIWNDSSVAEWEIIKHPALKGELILPMLIERNETTTLHAVVYDHDIYYSKERGLEVMPHD